MSFSHWLFLQKNAIINAWEGPINSSLTTVFDIELLPVTSREINVPDIYLGKTFMFI